MTVQAISLLWHLRYVQREECEKIYCCYDNHTFQSVVEKGQASISYTSKKSFSQLVPLFTYLSKLDMLHKSGNYITLTHKGFHYFQSMATRALHAIFASVILPILVSAITAIITTVITLKITS